MVIDLHALRKSAPDFVSADPLSAEVRAWLDQAYEAVKKIDPVEAVVLKLHEQSLSDRARRHVAGSEIAGAVDRAIRYSEYMRRAQVESRPAR